MVEMILGIQNQKTFTAVEKTVGQFLYIHFEKNANMQAFFILWNSSAFID